MEQFSWDSNMKVRLVGEGLFNLLFWMYFPFITVYFGQTLGLQKAGLLMTLPPLLSILGSLVGGNLADTWGRRPVMLVGTFLQMSMFVLFAASTSYWIDYIAFIGIGIGAAFYRPASSAMIADIVPERALRSVFATFSTVNNIGAVLGPVIGAVFFFQYRQTLLWTCAGILLLYLLALYFMMYETVPLEKKQEDVTSSLKHSFQKRWNGYRIIFQDRVFMLYVLAGIFSLFPIMQLDLYLPVYLIEQIPAQSLLSWTQDPIRLTSQSLFGWLVGFNGLLFVLLILPVTNALKHWSEKRLFIVSTLFAGVGTFLVGMSSNILYLFFCTVLFTLGEIIRTPVTQSFVSHYAPKQARGQFLAADSLQNTLGKTLAPLTVYLSGILSPISIFGVILFFSFTGVGLYLWLFRLYETLRRPKLEDNSQTS